jgi:hypothetical protein
MVGKGLGMAMDRGLPALDCPVFHGLPAISGRQRYRGLRNHVDYGKSPALKWHLRAQTTKLQLEEIVIAQLPPRRLDLDDGTPYILACSGRTGEQYQMCDLIEIP